jgi:hypothetical protein
VTHRRTTQNVVAVLSHGCKSILTLRTPRPRLTLAVVRRRGIAVSISLFQLVRHRELLWRICERLRHVCIAVSDAVPRWAPMVVVCARSVVLETPMPVVFLLRPERGSAPIARDVLMGWSPCRRLLCFARRCTYNRM